MPMVEYFDRASGTKKRKEFAYGAVGKENFRKFKAKQDAFARDHDLPKPKVTYPVKTNRMEGEKHTDTKPEGGPGVGVKHKPSPEQKLEDQQKFDEKEIDKNRPSEAKTKKKKKVKYVKLDEDDDRYHKRAVGGGGPDHRDITY